MTNRELTGLLLAAPAAVGRRSAAPPTARATTGGTSLDGARARAELGYQPRVEFRAGLADTVRWYREHRDWWQPLRVGDRTVVQRA
ncbi:hypothetical protein GCM10020229_42930 [Kitasatospora albolonga]